MNEKSTSSEEKSRSLLAVHLKLAKRYKISVLCPTRGRPQSASRLAESVRKTCLGNVSILFYCDDDDPTEKDYEVPHVVGPDFMFAMKCHLLAQVCDGDILMMCGDDAVFKTPSWDSALRTCNLKWPDGIWCASCWDGTPGKRNKDGTHKITHPHPAIGRKAFEVLGYVANPMFTHFCTDPWLTSMFQEIGRFKYFKDVEVAHLRTGIIVGQDADDTYARLRPGGRHLISQRDRTVKELFERYRKTDVELLKRAIEEQKNETNN